MDIPSLSTRLCDYLLGNFVVPTLLDPIRHYFSDERPSFTSALNSTEHLEASAPAQVGQFILAQV